MKSLRRRAVEAALAVADRAYLAELSLHGVEVGRGVELLGRPRIYNHGGRIILRNSVRLWSRDRDYIAHNNGVRLFAAAPNARIEIGARTRINGASISASKLVQIGEDCFLASGTTIMDTNGHEYVASLRLAGQRDEPKPVLIGNRVWIGLGVLILKGVTIGDETVIGAGSVVTRDLPAATVCAGNPARVIRNL